MDVVSWAQRGLAAVRRWAYPCVMDMVLFPCCEQAAMASSSKPLLPRYT